MYREAAWLYSFSPDHKHGLDHEPTNSLVTCHDLNMLQKFQREDLQISDVPELVECSVLQILSLKTDPGPNMMEFQKRLDVEHKVFRFPKPQGDSY